ncbi:hypothetical protein WJX72_005156 [[Myrmecia] bisecta]|uniref:Ubiquitin-like domain-containing protein n=1 Tax=[Myrmecia] bisecta TaxID=41462 RepID=A0AAW1P422_9CHLO
MAFAALDNLPRFILDALAQSPQIDMPASLLATLADDVPLCRDAVSSSVLSGLRYVKPSTPSTPSSIVTPGGEAHVDKGLLTIVYDNQPGLQVQSSTGEWQDVVLGKDQIAVFAGHTLERATFGLIPTALHRVRTLQSAERMSLSFKLRARPGALINFRHELSTTCGGWKGAGWSLYDLRLSIPITVADLMAEFDAGHSSVDRVPPRVPLGASMTGLSFVNKRTGATLGAQQTVLDAELQPGDSIVALADTKVKPLGASAPSNASESAVCIVNLVIKDLSGHGVHMRCRETCTVAKMQKSYARHVGKDEDKLKFIFDGDRLWDYRTLAFYDFADGDVIDVLIEQKAEAENWPSHKQQTRKFSDLFRTRSETSPALRALSRCALPPDRYHDQAMCLADTDCPAVPHINGLDCIVPLSQGCVAGRCQYSINLAGRFRACTNIAGKAGCCGDLTGFCNVPADTSYSCAAPGEEGGPNSGQHYCAQTEDNNLGIILRRLGLPCGTPTGNPPTFPGTCLETGKCSAEGTGTGTGGGSGGGSGRKLLILDSPQVLQQFSPAATGWRSSAPTLRCFTMFKPVLLVTMLACFRLVAADDSPSCSATVACPAPLHIPGEECIVPQPGLCELDDDGKEGACKSGTYKLAGPFKPCSDTASNQASCCGNGTGTCLPASSASLCFAPAGAGTGTGAGGGDGSQFCRKADATGYLINTGKTCGPTRTGTCVYTPPNAPKCSTNPNPSSGRKLL